jgi:hypothetical protein
VRRVVGASAKDDLALRFDAVRRTVLLVFDADGELISTELDLGDQGAQSELNPSPFYGRPQIGAPSACSDPVIDVGLVYMNALLAESIVVCVELVPCLLTRSKKCLEYWKVRFHRRNSYGTVPPRYSFAPLSKDSSFLK